MRLLFKRYSECEAGATAIEYGLIAALVAVGIIGSVSLTGNALDEHYDTVNRAVENAQNR